VLKFNKNTTITYPDFLRYIFKAYSLIIVVFNYIYIYIYLYTINNISYYISIIKYLDFK